GRHLRLPVAPAAPDPRHRGGDGRTVGIQPAPDRSADRHHRLGAEDLRFRPHVSVADGHAPGRPPALPGVAAVRAPAFRAMRWLARFLLWATPLTWLATLFYPQYLRFLCGIAIRLLALLGFQVTVRALDVLAPIDLALYTA